MRSMMLATLAAAICLVTTSRAVADLIVNGGFETGDFTGWTLTPAAPPPPLFGPNNVVDYFSNSGEYSAELGSTVLESGSLSQIVNTQAGVEYTLSFYLNCYDVNNNGPTNFFDVFFDGVLIHSETNRPDDDINWAHFSFTVVGNGGAQEVRFDFGIDALYFYLDNVSMTPVPVPAGFIMAGIGALGLAGMHLRRRTLARKTQLA